MSVPRTPIRLELLFGALCGLGVTLFLWIPFSAAPLRDADGLIFVALAAAAGALAADLSRPYLVYPAVLAAQMTHGLGPAVLTGGLAVILWVALGRGAALRRRLSRLPLELSKLSLGATIAGSLFVTGPWPLALHASSFAIVDLAASRLADPAWKAGERPARRRDLLLRAIGSASGVPAAWLVAAGHASPGIRPWLAMLPLGLFAFYLGRLPSARPGRARPRSMSRRSGSLYRSLTLGLARAAASTDPTLAGHQRRVELLSRAVAERLGAPHMEVEALSAAALLHESDRIILPDGPDTGSAVTPHPGMAAEILSTIRYPYAVLPIVRHLRERWDGTGRPDGLAGEAIPRGARILAVTDEYDSATVGRRSGRPVTPAQAVAQLRAEAGRRFDPLAVDLLLEHLEQSGEHTGGDGSRAGEPAPAPCALRTAERDLELLEQVRRAAGAALEVEDRLALISARVGVRLPHRAFVVYDLDEAKNRWVARFVFGKHVGGLRACELPADRGIFGLASREHRAILSDPADLPRAIDEAIAGPASTGGGVSCWVVLLPPEDRRRRLWVLYEDARHLAACDRALVVRVAPIVGSAIAGGRGERREAAVLTDPVTGLPNASYFRRAVSDRIPGSPRQTARFGLVAVAGVGAEGEDRDLCGAAGRLAAACGPEEALARFGPQQFVLLTPIHRPGELVERTRQILRALETRVDAVWAAHASWPQDGEDINDLLSTLDARLSLGGDHRLKLLPFRTARSAG